MQERLISLSRKRQVHRHIDDFDIGQLGGFFVETAHGSGAYRSVERRKYVEHHAGALIVCATDFSQIGAYESEARGFFSCPRHCAVSVAGCALKINGFHSVCSVRRECYHSDNVCVDMFVEANCDEFYDS